MAEKRIDSDFLEEETLNLESTGRYRVTGHQRARGEPGVTLPKFRPTKQKPRPVKPARSIAKATGRIERSRSRKVARRIFDLVTPASWIAAS